MSRVVQEEIQHDGEVISIAIEVDDVSPRAAAKTDPYGEMRDATQFVESRLQKGMELIRACAEQVATTVEQVSKNARPNEVEVEFGVKFDGEVGALISKTGVEAHLQVTLKWSRKESP